MISDFFLKKTLSLMPICIKSSLQEYICIIFNFGKMSIIQGTSGLLIDKLGTIDRANVLV
jgi:hypothetical protein